MNVARRGTVNRMGGRGAAVVAVLLMAGLIGPVSAQAQDAPSDRLQASRAELRQLEQSLTGKSDGASQLQLTAVRARLSQGDFQPNDRLVVRITGETLPNDTLTVRPDRTIELPNMSPISLAGVLRSELQPHLQREIGKYLRDPQVMARSLLRVSVLGGVSRPGFINVPSDALLTEVVTAAGGPTQDGRIEKTKIVRGTNVLYAELETRDAFSAGRSLDQLNLQNGDQIQVGRQKSGNGGLQILGIVTGLVAAVVGVATLAK